MSLTDILEQLVVYCHENGNQGKPKIQLILPKAVLDRYSLALQARERIIQDGYSSDQNISTIRTLYCGEGRVELFNDEDNLVVKKD